MSVMYEGYLLNTTHSAYLIAEEQGYYCQETMWFPMSHVIDITGEVDKPKGRVVLELTDWIATQKGIA